MRLIDADKLEQIFYSMSMCPSLEYCSAFNAGASRMFEEIKNAPTVDAIEVKHGTWEISFDRFAPYQRCSVCGFELPVVATENENEMYLYGHCPGCTARMDGEHK